MQMYSKHLSLSSSQVICVSCNNIGLHELNEWYSTAGKIKVEKGQKLMSHVVCEPVPEVSKYVRQSVDRHVYFTFDK